MNILHDIRSEFKLVTFVNCEAAAQILTIVVYSVWLKMRHIYFSASYSGVPGNNIVCFIDMLAIWRMQKQCIRKAVRILLRFAKVEQQYIVPVPCRIIVLSQGQYNYKKYF